MDIKQIIRTTLLVIADIIGANLAYGFALCLRFDWFGAIPGEYVQGWTGMIPLFSALVVVVFFIFRLYTSIWKYVSYLEVVRSFEACLVLGVLQYAGTVLFAEQMPLSYYFMGWILMFCILTGIRLSYRMLRIIRTDYGKRNKNLEQVLVAGCGEAGRSIIRQISQQVPRKSAVVCMADDDPKYSGKYIDGVPVRGKISDVPTLVEEFKIDRVIIAIPRATVEDQRRIISEIRPAHCKKFILPNLTNLDFAESLLGQVRNIEIEDLLERDPIKIDNSQVGSFLEDKIVLITGGGGSIGSELVRQVASFNPKRLILFDIYENTTYEVHQEIKRRYPGLDCIAIIGSIAEEAVVRRLFEKYRPDMVYHAAAHKHVPLMEEVPCEAIKNNVIGTLNCAKAAADFGVKRFLLISTDKAVNPTNIMGASKRLCEMVVKAVDERSETDFVAVRFGNVLGSHGSVVPLFKRQIAEGGPVTVTHPEITRFFMTIPEAVSLVLQSGAFAKGGELFVLDMGEPVKIDDLARNLIELSGFTPDVDIKIEYTGLRPGEKLYEEILMSGEDMGKTENDLIYIGKQTDTPANFLDTVKNLEKAAEAGVDDMIERVAAVVDTYQPKRDN